MAEPVDLSRLEEFADGSIDGVPRLVRLFLEDGEESMAELAAAGAGEDVAALRRIAHRFGGSAAACGAGRLAAALFDLEALAPSERTAAATPLLRAIDAAYAETTAFLTRYLEAHAQS